MAGPYNPPVKNQAAIFYIALRDLANPGSFKANPTLAAGDVKVQQDGGTLNNLGTLPSVSPASSIWVKITLTAGEMNGDNVCIQFIDQSSPKEWADEAIDIVTSS